MTLADLSGIATRANSLAAAGIEKGRDWPWCVFINDLRVVSELIESPAEFVLYLERRLHLNDLGMFAAYDELDYLAMFLREGLYYPPGGAPDAHRFVPFAYTVEIDRYYDYLAGRVSTGAKPRLRVTEGVRVLVRSLETSGLPGRTEAAKVLLSLDGDTQKKIDEANAELRRQAHADGEAHHLTLGIREYGIVVVAVIPSTAHDEPQATRRYCEAKRLQLDRPDLLCVYVWLQAGTDKISFELYEGPFRQDPGTIEMAERLRTKAIGRYVSEHGMPGRNDQCPCGKPTKFKKCCINRLPPGTLGR